MIKKYVISAVTLSLLTSCIPAIVGGGVASGGKVITQDKTVGESVSDGTIWTKIRTGFLTNNLDSVVGSVNLTVSEGRVLLTGKVKDQETMVKVIRVCWDQDGVNEVINELSVDDQRSSFGTYTKDSWITSQVKSKILFTRNIKSVNYTVETINGIVYLMGIARTQEELDTVTDLAARVSGVEKVVSYVKVRGSLENRMEKTQGNKASSSYPEYKYDNNQVAVDSFATNQQTIQPQTSSETKHIEPLQPQEIEITPKPSNESANNSKNWQKDEEFDDSF